MPPDLLFSDVILPFPLPQLFTYEVPESLQGKTFIGSRVIVPFGKRKFFTAIIAKLHFQKPENIEVKEILSVLDEKPIINNFQFKFWQWISEYYMCTPGEVMKAA